MSTDAPIVPTPFERSAFKFKHAVICVAAILLTGVAETSFAGSAMWSLSPGTNDWNTANNWSPPTAPNGPGDTATFGSSNSTGVAISVPTEVNSIVFNPEASAFAINVTGSVGLLISGAGITNNSGKVQSFSTDREESYFHFSNAATAGASTSFTNFGGQNEFTEGGFIVFADSSTAGSATFLNHGGMVPYAIGSAMYFSETATADHSVVAVNGGEAMFSAGAMVALFDSSSASDGVFTMNGGPDPGRIFFNDTSSAANAILIANNGSGSDLGGEIRFFDDSSGGIAHVRILGNGNADISAHNAPGLTIGSIEGDGDIFLGANNLTVGSNNLTTTFFGVIQDGGLSGESSGTLTKMGGGTLVLTNANTYTGGTTVRRGNLIVTNTSGSGTGLGPVHINSGRLGGTGIIAGSVTLGDRRGRAILSPGKKFNFKPGTLTIQGSLLFNPGATFSVGLNRDLPAVDRIVANGVTIGKHVVFSFASLGSGVLCPGKVFTVIENTSVAPIAGTFGNLPDNAVLTANDRNLRVSYEGGDGNDLTLTVVP
jgi:autotransporter-associated beta strand protein